MQFGQKTPQSAQLFGTKQNNTALQYGAKHIARHLHRVNSVAVPAFAMAGMPQVSAGLKAGEHIAKAFSK